MKKLLTALALAALLAGCNNASEQTPTPTEDRPSEQAQGESARETGENDSEALQKAYGDNLAEIRLAQLAQEKSGDEDVRALAHTIEEDHDKSAQRLRALGSTLQVDLSEDIPDDKEELEQRLKELNGEEFDQQYVNAQVELHQKAVEFYEHQGAANRAPQLATYFQQTLPILQDHLKAARELSAQ